MYKFLNPFLDFKNLWVSFLVILLVGIFSNFFIAGGILVLYLISSGSEYKNQFILLILLAACVLASNLTASFSFAQNFRFVALGVALVFLFYNKILPSNPAKYFLPFTIYAVFITAIFSPLGFEAVLRGVAYWFMALIVFSAYEKSYKKQPYNTARLILGLIMLFFGINFLLIFLGSEVFLEGRFRGLMGNPNELGLLAIFSYGIIALLGKRNETSFPDNYIFILKILLIVTVILTGSRTALFGLILYELVQRLYNDKFLLLFSIMFIGALYYLSLSLDYVAIVHSLGLSDQLRVETLATGSGRTEVWKVAWEEIQRNPWFGSGMLYDNYFILEYGEEHLGPIRARHWFGIWNSYLSLLLDVGIIGLMAFLFFVFKVFKLSNHKNIAAGFLAMTFFGGITESWMAASMNAFTPMFLMYWAIQSHPPQDEVENMIEE